jgi:hypothetical protein
VLKFKNKFGSLRVCGSQCVCRLVLLVLVLGNALVLVFQMAVRTVPRYCVRGTKIDGNVSCQCMERLMFVGWEILRWRGACLAAVWRHLLLACTLTAICCLPARGSNDAWRGGFSHRGGKFCVFLEQNKFALCKPAYSRVIVCCTPVVQLAG